ncbi:hypothetical protein [Spongiactinospora sp. 9N601]|uniref:hypothetical protein n=1 Tax=Spongiactinospora sp. 9N601 TaxID=3375149 RepID=UPI003795D9CF
MRADRDMARLDDCSFNDRAGSYHNNTGRFVRVHEHFGYGGDRLQLALGVHALPGRYGRGAPPTSVVRDPAPSARFRPFSEGRLDKQPGRLLQEVSFVL